ncbi:NAD-dependent epimerase/dehydratase family protein [uncultured Nitrospira sp.]|uniref:NAD-dependent epimerase/dehydratase family protein n=1 Tax=uncultured Nitrospira sp. TaxID=157176 RepID=UPI0031405B7E
MFKGSKVLVTGAGGFLGTNIAKRLVEEGSHVRGTLHTRSPQFEHQRLEYVQADLTNMEDCRRVVEGMDYVFMCAANTSGAAVMATQPLAHVTPNVVMNAQMLEASYQAKIKKFLFISSSAAYPPSGDRPVSEEEMFVGDPYEAYFSVGWMKRYGEVLCRIYSEKIKDPMNTVVVRPSNVYGPYDKFDFERSHVTAALTRKVIERQDPLEVWGTGEDVRDLIYVDDFVDAVMLAMATLDQFDPVNIGYGNGRRVRDVLTTLLEIDQFQHANVVINPTKPSMIPIRLIDVSKAKVMLNFTAQTSLAMGLNKTLVWYRESHGAKERLRTAHAV